MAASLAKPYQQHHQHYHQQQMKSGSKAGGVVDVKRTVNLYMNKLSDRDTEAMAASELESMARSLTPDSLPPFLSAISDTRPSDKTPLRRHCVRLLSFLSQSHPPNSLTPLLPRMLSAVLRRLRDPDSSVRSACVDAVRSMASSSSSAPFSSVFLRPLSESLLLEQDHNAQMASAMCLAAAVDGAVASIPSDPDRALQLQRLLPRLLKLARSDAFKAKPALLSLLGAVVAAGGASTPAALGILIPCLTEFLSSEDWAARKAAAEALHRVASISDAHLLAAFKASCISSYESRRFDKVKIVRESMNQMLEAWKDLPCSLAEDGANNAKASHSPTTTTIKETTSEDRMPPGPRNASSTRSATSISAKNNRSPVSRSPPPEASPAPASRRNSLPSSDRRSSPPLFRKLDRNKKPSDWRIEITLPQAHPLKAVHENKLGEEANKARFQSEIRGQHLESDSDDKAPANSRAGVPVVPFQGKGTLGSFNGSPVDEVYKTHMENSDLSLIRRQLVLIENQQSNLMDMLQKFIGTSQNGIRALETRVHGLEVALDEISQDMAGSAARMANADSSVKTCCKLPGAEFLSSKIWRRSEGRYSSRLSFSSSSAFAGIRNSSDKDSMDSSNWDKKQFGVQGGFVVNPLAEVDPRAQRSSEFSSVRMLKNVMHDSGYRPAQDGKRYDEASASTCSSAAGILNRST